MKMSEFRKIRLRNPWLDSVVCQKILSWGFSNCDELRVFVRKKLAFIAFRPFETLNLNSSGSLDELPGKIISYFIFFHHEGDGREYCDYASLSGGTIKERIERLETRGFGLDKTRKLVWDRVIKETTGGGTTSLEVYPFPPWFGTPHPSTIKDPPLNPYELEARRAYVSGGPMPPIYPGQFLGARA